MEGTSTIASNSNGNSTAKKADEEALRRIAASAGEQDSGEVEEDEDLEDEEDEEEEDEEGDEEESREASRQRTRDALSAVAGILGGKAPVSKTVRRWNRVSRVYDQLLLGKTVNTKTGKAKVLDAPKTAQLVLKFLKMKGVVPVAVPHTVCTRFDWSKAPAVVEALKVLAAENEVAVPAFFLALGMTEDGKAAHRTITEPLARFIPVPPGVTPPAVPEPGAPKPVAKPEPAKAAPPSAKNAPVAAEPPKPKGKPEPAKAATKK